MDGFAKVGITNIKLGVSSQYQNISVLTKLGLSMDQAGKRH